MTLFCDKRRWLLGLHRSPSLQRILCTHKSAIDALCSSSCIRSKDQMVAKAVYFPKYSFVLLSSGNRMPVTALAGVMEPVFYLLAPM